MSGLQTLVAFLAALTLLIFVHELGHYLVARWCGVKVLRFSIGFGKPLARWHVGPDRTEWTLAMIPLGGYVRMLDERESQDSPIPANELSRAFSRKPLSQRAAIVAAGPLANFLLAILLYAVLGRRSRRRRRAPGWRAATGSCRSTATRCAPGTSCGWPCSIR